MSASTVATLSSGGSDGIVATFWLVGLFGGRGGGFWVKSRLFVSGIQPIVVSSGQPDCLLLVRLPYCTSRFRLPDDMLHQLRLETREARTRLRQVAAAVCCVSDGRQRGLSF